MKRVAVLGASGFIGNRAVEMLHSSGAFEVRPVVRRASAAALPRRFDLDVRVADGREHEALTAAFQDCDSVVVSVAGPPATIVGVIEPIFQAATAAGVRRLVYLSSASVHGQAPVHGVDEGSPLSERQPIEYNNAKVAAELKLDQLGKSGGPEVVTLRPGIVFGPRSQWIGGWADELLSGQAYLVDGARGLCNAIYMDDVVRAIISAMEAPGAPGRAYLLGQTEQVTWRDLYRPICDALGFDLEALPDYPAGAARPEPPASGSKPLLPPALRGLKKGVPESVRVGVRAALRHRRSGQAAGSSGGPAVSMERALLHTADYVPPWRRAADDLGYRPVTSFEDGVRQSVAWLGFAGYPVKDPRR